MADAKTYDYVIVGAGSAGCVLANRLSADKHTRVLLLEAGGRDSHPFIHIPLGLGHMHKRRMFDWGYDSEPEPNLNGRRIEAMRGKVLGGSSSINVMAFTRGDPGDYDRWDSMGAHGWAYKDVLPYFKRLESWEDGESEKRGGDGPIGVEWAKTKDPLFEAWIEAAVAAGYAHTQDYNSAPHEGFGRSQYSIRNGRRSSSANAYLRPAESRANLHVETNALALKILIEKGRAAGIEYAKGRSVERVRAERENILSAGTFNTPQLLMLSGIGPAGHLNALGIRPVIDLPVGKNLQDHIAVQVTYTRPEAGSFRKTMRFDRMAMGLIRAHLFGTGPATIVPGGLHAFIKTEPELSVPDIEFMFRGTALDAHLWFPLVRKAYLDGFGIRPTLLHPKSTGSVQLASADPKARPRIFFNLLSAPEDLPLLRQGVRRARIIAHQNALDHYRGEERTPGSGTITDADIDAWIRKVAVTAHHPAGTCAMGNKQTDVLDPFLRVRGIERLRVVDASAMPDMVSAHINACVLMMAEKAADLILGKQSLPE
jgi:choline dehydrogenase-like flavoprotein